jgi:membrane AbrB-like protein
MTQETIQESVQESVRESLQQPVSSPSGWIAALTPTWQWVALFAASAGAGALLAWLGVPAALLLGPMLAAIAISVGGGRVRVPVRAISLAQGIVGCMIANMLPASIGGEVAGHWPIFALGVFSVIAASGVLGWLLTQMRVLPGTTIVWGLSPGAASAMTIMAGAHGADVQLVALMQYLRVVVVAAFVSVVARIWGVSAHHAAAAITWFPAIAWLPFIETLALAGVGAAIATRLRISAGALLLPLGAGIVLTQCGLMTIELPRWLLAIAYALVGWQIGLRFTWPLFVHAAKALPRILVCTLALIALCGGLAALLVVIAGIDPLTAYLATSPGGADTVAIIAASSNVDAPFVMTMQILRSIAILLLGPAMAKLIAGQVDAGHGAHDIHDP